MINTDNFVIHITVSDVNCGTLWYFILHSAFQLLMADNFGIFRILSGVTCGQFWYFPLENENESDRDSNRESPAET